MALISSTEERNNSNELSNVFEIKFLLHHNCICGGMAANITNLRDDLFGLLMDRFNNGYLNDRRHDHCHQITNFFIDMKTSHYDVTCICREFKQSNRRNNMDPKSICDNDGNAKKCEIVENASPLQNNRRTNQDGSTVVQRSDNPSVSLNAVRDVEDDNEKSNTDSMLTDSSTADPLNEDLVTDINEMFPDDFDAIPNTENMPNNDDQLVVDMKKNGLCSSTPKVLSVDVLKPTDKTFRIVENAAKRKHPTDEVDKVPKFLKLESHEDKCERKQEASKSKVVKKMVSNESDHSTKPKNELKIPPELAKPESNKNNVTEISELTDVAIIQYILTSDIGPKGKTLYDEILKVFSAELPENTQYSKLRARYRTMAEKAHSTGSKLMKLGFSLEVRKAFHDKFSVKNPRGKRP